MMKYDVFISCKSEDYQFAQKIYDYLIAHNYNTFLADTELRKKGNAEYGEIIDEALDSAKHLIIVASNSQYVVSTYVKSEWRTFLEEKRAGRKAGNIVTVIDFSVDLLPIGLRHFQSFGINSYSNVVDYLPQDINRKDNVQPKEPCHQSNKDVGLNAKQIKYEDLDNETLHTLSKAEYRNANIELGKRYFLGNKGKFQSENIAKYYWNKAGVTVEDYLKSLNIKDEKSDCKILLRHINIKDVLKWIDTGFDYYQGVNGKSRSQSMATYYWDKVNSSIEELLESLDSDIRKLNDEALLVLCKIGDVQAYIEMGLRYFRGIKGKSKSRTMAKYYWSKL